MIRLYNALFLNGLILLLHKLDSVYECAPAGGPVLEATVAVQRNGKAATKTRHLTHLHKALSLERKGDEFNCENTAHSWSTEKMKPINITFRGISEHPFQSVGPDEIRVWWTFTAWITDG